MKKLIECQVITTENKVLSVHQYTNAIPKIGDKITGTRYDDNNRYIKEEGEVLEVLMAEYL